MAGTQELPPWLTYSYTTYTDTAGALTTSTAVLQLPLTYYGPSIPLGPEWTYGGLTSPASTRTTRTTSSTPSTTVTSSPTTTLPSSTSAIPSSTSLPSSGATSSGITSTPTSSAATSSRTSASSTYSGPVPSASSEPGLAAGLNGRQIAAIVCGVVAFILLCVCLFCCWFLSKRRRMRRSQLAHSGSTWKGFVPVTPTTRPSSNRSRSGLSHMSSMFSFVGGRRPGEGSPRQSGEEADSLLRESRSRQEMAQRDHVGPAAVWAVNAAGEHIFLRHSGSTKSGDQQNGVRVDDLGRPLVRIAADKEESPLLPPRPIDPDGLGLARMRSGETQKRVQIGGAEDITARDRKESGLTQGSDALPSSSSEGAVRGGNGLSPLQMRDDRTVSWVPEPEYVAALLDFGERGSEGGPPTPGPSPVQQRATPGDDQLREVSSRFSKFSWLSRRPSQPAIPEAGPSRRSRSRSRSRSRPGSGEIRVSYAEIPSIPETPPLRPRPKKGLLSLPGSSRPASTVSAQSGTSAASTVYHSAGGGSSMGSRESQQARHAFDVRPGADSIPPVPALPPAAAQSGRERDAHSRTPTSDRTLTLMHSSTPTSERTLSQDRTPTQQRSPAQRAATPPASSPAEAARRAASAARIADILDTPAPSATATFSSTASSARPRPTPLAIPPGLGALPQPGVWATAESTTATPSSVGAHRLSALGDALDAAPPRPGSLWRNLADARDRGQLASAVSPVVNNPRDSLPTSLHLSLGHCSNESLHSHYGGPNSPRAAGSVPLSTYTGSGSSRSQPYSTAGSSGLELLQHQRSVDEDGRRRGLRSGNPSPAGTRSTFGNASTGEGMRALSAAPSLSAFGFPDSPASRSSNPFTARLAERALRGDDTTHVDQA